MKEKILAALKIKFANLGFTDKAFDGVAALLAVTTTEETQIETAVGGVETLLKGFQGDADSRVNTAIAKTKEELKKPVEGGDPEPPTDPKKTTVEKTATEILLDKALAGIETLTGEITKMKGADTEATRRAQIELILKDANPAYKAIIMENFDYVKGIDQTNFDTFVTKTTEGIASFTKTLNEQGLKNVPKPTITPVVGEGKKSDFATNMREIVDQKIAEKEASAK